MEMELFEKSCQGQNLWTRGLSKTAAAIIKNDSRA